jgi:hypothetical protein
MQYTHRFTARRVRVSAFAGGVLISRETTHEEMLFGAEAETFVLRMAALGDRRELPEGHTHLEKDRGAELCCGGRI